MKNPDKKPFYKTKWFFITFIVMTVINFVGIEIYKLYSDIRDRYEAENHAYDVAYEWATMAITKELLVRARDNGATLDDLYPTSLRWIQLKAYERAANKIPSEDIYRTVIFDAYNDALYSYIIKDYSKNANHAEALCKNFLDNFYVVLNGHSKDQFAENFDKGTLPLFYVNGILNIAKMNQWCINHVRKSARQIDLYTQAVDAFLKADFSNINSPTQPSRYRTHLYQVADIALIYMNAGFNEYPKIMSDICKPVIGKVEWIINNVDKVDAKYKASNSSLMSQLQSSKNSCL